MKRYKRYMLFVFIGIAILIIHFQFGIVAANLQSTLPIKGKYKSQIPGNDSLPQKENPLVLEKTNKKIEWNFAASKSLDNAFFPPKPKIKVPVKRPHQKKKELIRTPALKPPPKPDFFKVIAEFIKVDAWSSDGVFIEGKFYREGQKITCYQIDPEVPEHRHITLQKVDNPTKTLWVTHRTRTIKVKIKNR